MTSSNIVICGNGRIGAALQQRLSEQSLVFQTARLSPLHGLVFTDPEATPDRIRTLVICIAPRGRDKKPQAWQWQDIFVGLSKQLQDSVLKVENIVMVSSTRVYEAIERGLVTANTPPRGISPRALGLIAAEQQLLQSPANVCLLRCSGLYGDLYPVYTPILIKGESRPRFGIDANQVIERLYQVVKASLVEPLELKIELLTDGKVYFEGRVFSWPVDRAQVIALAQEFRILLNSSGSISRH